MKGRERASGLPRGLMWFAVALAFATLVIEYGFRRTGDWIDWLDYGLAGLFGLDLALVLWHSPKRKEALRARWHEFTLLGLFGLSLLLLGLFTAEDELAPLLGVLHARSVAKLLLALVQIYLLITVVIRTVRVQERYLSSRIPAEYLFVGSFAVLILGGTLLLWLPGCRAPEADPLGFLDALFTSTSASCVTGLAVRDTGADFSLLGQTVILFLFQVGGLGIITFVAFGSVLVKGRFTIPQAVALRDLTNTNSLSEAQRFVWQVVLWMLGIELAGAVLLFTFLPHGVGDVLERAHWSLFHSVSAFCNAGFSLESSSLVAFRGVAGLNFVLIALIVLGGLGMPVTRELLMHRVTRAPFFRRFQFFKRLHYGTTHKRLSLQTRLSLWMTGVLLSLGFFGFWLLERNGALTGLGFGESFLASVFQSATTRTAGFNTVPFDELSDATLVLMMGLMAIGAGPVSTGGGIKTVTFAVLLVALRAMASGRPGVEVAGRSLSRTLVRGALSVFVLYMVSVSVLLLALSISDPQVPFRDRLFEVFSALSTVGLSSGGTDSFGTFGRVALCFAMFVGRVGPLALVLSVFRSRRGGQDYAYPEEELVVS